MAQYKLCLLIPRQNQQGVVETVSPIDVCASPSLYTTPCLRKKSSARGRYIIRWTVRMERPPTTVNYAVGYKKVPLDIRS